MTISLLLLAVAAGPFDGAPTVAPQWVGDARPKGEVRRIVSLAPSLTELLFALELGDHVVGVSKFADHPAEATRRPKVGGFLDPNVEAIVALKPDLVLAVANAGNRAALARLSELGVPAYAVPGNAFADTAHAIRAVGALLGGPTKARATRMIAGLRAGADRIRARYAGRPAQRVLVVFSYDPLIVAGDQSLAHTALALIGARNVAPAGRGYPQIGLEGLVVAAPEVIVDAATTMGSPAAPPWRGLDAVPAVAKGRVRAVPLALTLRPGPRILEGVEALAAAIYGAPGPAAKSSSK